MSLTERMPEIMVSEPEDCSVCHLPQDGGTDSCECPQCPECGECGDTVCYQEHGLTLDERTLRSSTKAERLEETGKMVQGYITPDQE